MKLNRIAWLGLVGGFAGAAGFVGACTGDQVTDPGGNGICGDSIVDTGEECDDGNVNDDDDCKNDCTSNNPSGGECRDGKLDNGEECDDGNTNDGDSCKNDCTVNEALCNNNGTPEGDEECDDGNNVPDDGCTNACTLPKCGDGIQQGGEDCDDGDSELNDQCPDDCKLGGPGGGSGTGGGGEGGEPCTATKTFYGVVSNNLNPMMSGTGVTPNWSYNGFQGVQAGDNMCKAIGADHACKYHEILKADQDMELGTLDKNLTYWLHRTTNAEPVPNVTYLPGAGARCNDWTYTTGHISDGEWFEVYSPGSTFNGGGYQIGTLSFHFDKDPIYDANAPGAHTNANVNLKGGAGPCGTTKRAILCCNPACQ